MTAVPTRSQPVAWLPLLLWPLVRAYAWWTDRRDAS